LNAEDFLVILKLTKHPTDGLVLLWNSELVKVAALLKHLDLVESLRKILQHLESKFLREQIGDEGQDAHLAVLVQISLKD
jgi:hypothetical protein